MIFLEEVVRLFKKYLVKRVMFFGVNFLIFRVLGNFFINVKIGFYNFEVEYLVEDLNNVF